MWKYCGSIFQLGFFIFYIIFLPFISFSSIHISFLFFFFFLFLVFLLHTIVQPPSFIFLFTLRTFQRITSEKRDREREREREIGLGLHHMHLHRRSSCYSNISTAARHPPHQSTWVRSACSFFFLFFFSYLLVLIQLYFKNWILFCIWIVWEMGLDRLVIFFFFFFFFSYLLVLIQLYFKN